MFTMANTLNLKWIQVTQEEIQTERRKSEMEKLSMNHIFEVKRIMVFCILE